MYIPSVVFSQSPDILECRLKLVPLSFECLDQEKLLKEKKIRENVFVPESQIEVFKTLEKKEQKIQQQTEAQLAKSVELRQIEERIEQKLNQLRLEREKFETLRQDKIKLDEENIGKLVAYYEKMDPENASKFFNSMDINTASQIIMRMNPRKGSKVMELLNVPISVKITETVAGFRKNIQEASGLENPNRTVPQTLN